MQIIQETRHEHVIWYLRFYYTVLSRVNSSAGGLFLHEGIIRPVVLLDTYILLKFAIPK
jgi:hypothetical protein